MKKKLFIGAVLIAGLLAGGFGFKKVNIEGGKLIDLEAILTPNLSIPTVEDGESDKDTVQETQEGNKDIPQTDITLDRLQITVRNTTVSCMGRSYNYNRDKDTIEDFERVINLALKSAEIRVEDDYGEAHAVSCVLRLIYEGTGREASIMTGEIVKRGQ